MTALDKQMDEMLLEIKYLKSDKYVNKIKADAVEYCVLLLAHTYWGDEARDILSEHILELRNK